jgi:hypothetical protein
MPLKVGLLCGRESSFPAAFLEAVNRRGAGVVAEPVKLGGTRMDEPCPYAVVVDRISHDVPYYRSYLKNAVLQGARVVNNPFMAAADDRFFEATLAAKLGVAHLKTLSLPNKHYAPDVVASESLRNLIYPLDWQGIVDYVGLPCILKDAHDGGRRDAAVCRTVEELIHCYDRSGLRSTIVQEFVQGEPHLRCLCVGQEDVLPMRFDPVQRKHLADPGRLDGRLEGRIVDDSLTLVRALGYDLNVVEWAVRDVVPIAVDVLDPAPDLEAASLTPHSFSWAVDHVADMAVKMAIAPRPQRKELRWNGLF